MHIGNENFFVGNSCVHALQAFNVLHKRYRARIRNLIGHHIQREEDIDDMLQIVFLNGFQCFNRGRRHSMFYPT